MPKRRAARLVERILKNAVRCPQARRIASVAGWIRRHAFLPEFHQHLITVLVLFAVAVPTTLRPSPISNNALDRGIDRGFLFGSPSGKRQARRSHTRSSASYW